METLINILLGFLFFMFIAICIVMVCSWLLMQFLHENKKTASQEECGCKTCECDEPFIIEGYHNGMEIEDDTIPMLDRPLTKKELKEMNMEEQNKEYNVMTGEDMMNMKTEVSQTASPENMNKSFRGESYKEDNERMDIIGQNGNDGLHYDNIIRESEDVIDGLDNIGKHNRDYINFLDEQERKSKKDYHNEPLEENDPNPPKK